MQESLAEISPIIFEECYCIDRDAEFVERVKVTNEISETKIMEIDGGNAVASGGQSENDFVGVHLFVLVHGF